MTAIDVQTIITVVVLPLLVGLIWLIRLEGRVNVNQALQERMAADIAYVRRRVDRWMGGNGDDE